MRPPEEVKKEIVRQWLAKAEQDIEAAQALLSEKRLLLFPSCFHSQQAAEKYIKAYLTWHQTEFPKTHVLGELLDLMGEVDDALAKSLSSITSLNPYGVEVRYPGDLPEPTSAHAEEALRLAQATRDAILRSLPPLKRP